MLRIQDNFVIECLSIEQVLILNYFIIYFRPIYFIMVLRIIINFLSRFANSEQMIQKLSESYPIRRSAQMMAYFYHRTKGTIESGSIQGKLPPINNRILTFKNRFMNEFRQEMQNSKNKIKR